MEYSPLNLTVWLLFMGFAVFAWGIVRLFARKYPNYPGCLYGKSEEGSPHS